MAMSAERAVYLQAIILSRFAEVNSASNKYTVARAKMQEAKNDAEYSYHSEIAFRQVIVIKQHYVDYLPIVAETGRHLVHVFVDMVKTFILRHAYDESILPADAAGHLPGDNGWIPPQGLNMDEWFKWACCS
jgi:hypothetical protein